jgi:phosphoribosylformimino-5-aminoimidazole carboxamide ribonucleotide (ProFAR) isomerase
MRLRYLNSEAVEPVKIYGGSMAKHLDIVDTAGWNGVEAVLIGKALKSGLFELVEDSPELEVTQPPRRGRPPKVRE